MNLNRILTVLLCAVAALPARAEGVAEGVETGAARPVVSEIMAANAGQARSFPGLIVAKTEADLGFQTAGRIAARLVSVGDRVTSGQVLARLDQVTLEQDVAAARAAVSAAQASADLAAQTLARAQELAKRGVASPAQLEGAQANRDATAAQVLAAQADAARAMDAARFATLRAPMDGIVLATFAEAGAVVSAGTTVLTLASEAGREAVIDVPADRVALLPEAAKFRVFRHGITDAQHGGQAAATAPVSGVLRLIEPVADASTRARRLRVTLTDAGTDTGTDTGGDGGQSGGDLRLGSLVTAELDLAQTPDLAVPLSVPLEALFARTGARAQVWRVTPDRHAQAVWVGLGVEAVGRVLVTSGLAVGDEILIRGVNSVVAGMVLGPRIGGDLGASQQEGAK